MWKTVVVFALSSIGYSMADVQITCYNCVTPWRVENFESICSDKSNSTTCQGTYCTKGPDAKSNGIYHGCTDVPPLDNGEVSECKLSPVNKVNCYCKNIDFCNGTVIRPVFMVLIVICANIVICGI